MAIRKIVLLGDPVLREKARRVRNFDRKLHQLLDDMVETLHHAPGVGLAAPQVGASERVIIVRLPDDEESREEFGEQAGKLYQVINPEIVKASREVEVAPEGCLSIPGYYGNVERHRVVTVQGQDRHGKQVRVKAYDWLARVFQHEIDHLDGILFIDRATEVWQQGKESADGEQEADAEDMPVSGDSH